MRAASNYSTREIETDAVSDSVSDSQAQLNVVCACACVRFSKRSCDFFNFLVLFINK